MRSLIVACIVAGLGVVRAGAQEVNTIPPGCEAAAKSALEVVRAYIDGFNSRDIVRFESTMHYPNVRHADGKLFWNDKPSGNQGLFDTMVKMGWDHTTLDETRIVECGPDKVHVTVRVTRHGKEAPLHSFDSLYVVTLVDGRWGISIRSSYAPEPLAPRPR